MSTLTDAAEALALARTVVAGVKDESYATVGAYEAAANEAREALDAAMVAIDTDYGAAGFAAFLAMENVAARLLDLREAINAESAAVEEAYPVVTSLIEIAVESYDDHARWEDLVLLNPNLPHPGFISAGRTVVRHVE